MNEQIEPQVLGDAFERDLAERTMKFFNRTERPSKQPDPDHGRLQTAVLRAAKPEN